MNNVFDKLSDFECLHFDWFGERRKVLRICPRLLHRMLVEEWPRNPELTRVELEQRLCDLLLVDRFDADPSESEYEFVWKD